MNDLIRLNENICDDECGGCSCHISPPCPHCVNHMITQEYKDELVCKSAKEHDVAIKMNIVKGKHIYSIEGSATNTMAMIEDLNDQGIDLVL